MAAAADSLILELQILKADRAWLTDLGSLQEVPFDVDPLYLAQGLRGLLYQAQSFCQAQIINVLHALLLNVVVGACFSHLAIKEHLIDITSHLRLVLSLACCAAVPLPNVRLHPHH